MQSITSVEIIRSLIGAWRLFLRNPKGVLFFDRDITAFWKSFWCAPLVFPMYLVLIISNPLMPAEIYEDLLRFVSVELSAYVLGWVVWPLLMIQGTKLLQREKHYLAYITMYNWSAAPIVLFGLVIAALEVSGLVPLAVIASLSVGFLVWRFIIHAFLFKVSMELGIGKSFPFVLGDFMVGQFILTMKFTLLGVNFG